MRLLFLLVCFLQAVSILHACAPMSENTDTTLSSETTTTTTTTTTTSPVDCAPPAPLVCFYNQICNPLSEKSSTDEPYNCNTGQKAYRSSYDEESVTGLGASSFACDSSDGFQTSSTEPYFCYYDETTAATASPNSACASLVESNGETILYSQTDNIIYAVCDEGAIYVDGAETQKVKCDVDNPGWQKLDGTAISTTVSCVSLGSDCDTCYGAFGYSTEILVTNALGSCTLQCASGGAISAVFSDASQATYSYVHCLEGGQAAVVDDDTNDYLYLDTFIACV